jgi:HKD family nuclease
MLSILKRKASDYELIDSQLLNEDSFYDNLMRDLKKCHSEIIIESPFITRRRLALLMPLLQKLKQRNVRIAVNTRDPYEHTDEYQRNEAHKAIATLQHNGIHVLYTSGHHRKLAIIDRQILYEGSLNILSQNNSCEVMRRIESVKLAWQMARFIDIDKVLT